MIAYQELTIDLQPDNRGLGTKLYLSEYDVGRPVQINVLMQGEPYAFVEGTTARVNMRKPSGHVVSVDASYAVGTNIALFTVVEQMTAEPGTCLTEFSITGDGQEPLGSKNWFTSVEVSPLHAGDDSESWIADVQETLEAGTQAVEQAREVLASIPEDYSALDAEVDALRAAVGTPLVAQTSASMTDINKIYVYAGNESEYIYGHWYYWTGTEWADGGLYNSPADSLKADAFRGDASGEVISFDDGGDLIPVKSLVLNLEPHQSGSGDPSPSNIRPISGYDSVNVTRCGKNLLPSFSGIATNTVNGITWTYNDDGTVTANGTATATAFSRYIVDFYLKPGTYKKPIDTYVQYISTSNNWILVSGGGSSSTEFVITEEVSQYPIVYRCRVASGETVTNKVFYPYVYLSNVTDSTYEPYQGTTYPISLASAGAVYGGTLDVTTGELVVGYAKYTFTGNEISIAWASAINGARYYNTAIADGVYLADSCVVCNMMPNDNSSDGLCFYQSGTSGNHNLYFKNLALLDSSITNADTFKTWLSNNTLEVTYKLATPQTYQLTPTEVTTLLGENTIWMDAEGTIDVTYRADTTIYFDEKTKSVEEIIAPVEDSFVATQNYARNSYVIINNKLYIITLAVAQGETITPGTNCIAVTLDEILSNWITVNVNVLHHNIIQMINTSNGVGNSTIYLTSVLDSINRWLGYGVAKIASRDGQRAGIQVTDNGIGIVRAEGSYHGKSNFYEVWNVFGVDTQHYSSL